MILEGRVWRGGRLEGRDNETNRKVGEKTNLHNSFITSTCCSKGIAITLAGVMFWAYVFLMYFQK